MHTMFVFTRYTCLYTKYRDFFSPSYTNKPFSFTNLHISYDYLATGAYVYHNHFYTLCGFSVAHQASPDMEHGFHSSHSRTTSKFISMQCCIIYIRPRIKLYFKLMHTYHISPFPLLSTLPLSTPFSLFTWQFLHIVSWHWRYICHPLHWYYANTFLIQAETLLNLYANVTC